MEELYTGLAARGVVKIAQIELLGMYTSGMVSEVAQSKIYMSNGIKYGAESELLINGTISSEDVSTLSLE